MPSVTTLSSHKTGGSVLAEILMHRQAFKGTFLVVEGETDSRFWRPHIDKNACSIVIAGGKKTVEDSISRVDSNQIKGVLGIIDDDLDSIVGAGYASRNLLKYDFHDLEAMILQTDAFEKVIADLGDQSAILALETATGKTVRETFMALVYEIGVYRWLARQANWDVPFLHDGHPRRFINESWLLDTQALLAWFLSHVSGETEATIDSRRQNLPNVNKWNVNHGHDCIHILVIGLKKLISNKSITFDHLSSTLRIAFTATHLAATAIYQSIKRWESSNTPYRITP